MQNNIDGDYMKKLFLCLSILLAPLNVFAYSDYIYRGGNTLGIEVECDGVLIVGFYQINGKYNKGNPNLKVGDYIKEDTNNNEGTVTEISLFYTKLVTYDEKIIVLPNGTLANNSLTNVTGTDTRRLDLKIGVAYDSDIKKVKAVIAKLLESETGVIKDREINIFVDDLADSSIVIGVRCYAKQSEFWQVKWRVLENIKLTFDENGIEIPYPKMDVQIRS